eukprot:scaffold2200_cov413-Prasinococcus_capsulatus_cf.AAC.12
MCRRITIEQFARMLGKPWLCSEVDDALYTGRPLWAAPRSNTPASRAAATCRPIGYDPGGSIGKLKDCTRPGVGRLLERYVYAIVTPPALAAEGTGSESGPQGGLSYVCVEQPWKLCHAPDHGRWTARRSPLVGWRARSAERLRCCRRGRPYQGRPLTLVQGRSAEREAQAASAPRGPRRPGRFWAQKCGGAAEAVQHRLCCTAAAYYCRVARRTWRVRSSPGAVRPSSSCALAPPQRDCGADVGPVHATGIVAP